MEVHTLAHTVVDRIMDLEERMRQPMIWNVTDILIEYEKLFLQAKCTLQDADMALLANGLKRDDPTRKRIREMIQKLDQAA